MKLEHFDDAYEGEDVLLIHSGAVGEVEFLRTTLRKLFACGTSVALHDLEFIDAVDDCKVTASSVATGGGVHALAGSRAFAWDLSPSDWERVVDLLEPFRQPLPTGSGACFEYLHECGGTQVIYSTAREW